MSKFVNSEHQWYRDGRSRFGYQILSVVIATVFFLAGCNSNQEYGFSNVVELENTPVLQGWDRADRLFWSRASGGSRLIPYTWLAALESHDTGQRIIDEMADSKFGYLANNNFRGPLPFGFAIDQQPDTYLQYTKLRWYTGQKGGAIQSAEPWVGLSCGACHTSDWMYEGDTLRIYGAAAMGDLQKLVRQLHQSVKATRIDPLKWKRFAAHVLGERNDKQNRDLLHKATGKWLRRITEIARLESPRLEHGFGRVDAFGHIYNSLQLFSGAETPLFSNLDAPVNYPHVWNNHKQRRVQWNGFTENKVLPRVSPNSPDPGAWARNAGAFVGGFAEIVPQKKNETARLGFRSSLNMPNMQKLEALIVRLKPPDWPKIFPPINHQKAARGAMLYDQHCVSCHKLPDALRTGVPSETLHHFNNTEKVNQTDIWMACNTFTFDMPTGALQGIKENYVIGTPLQETAPAYVLLNTSMIASLLGQLDEIVHGIPTALLDIIDKNKVSLDDAEPRPVIRTKQQRREECLTSNHPLLTYKARPLDGIWATAPYLHNGSVPTLYDLLLPANERPIRFKIGSKEYDPIKLGLSTKEGPVNGTFEFSILDPAGKPIPGNSNAGHVYGVRSMTEADRWALIEFIKGL